MTTKEVARRWWSGSHSEGKNGTGSVYFRGSTIFSYGEHYPLARKVNGIVLFNSTGTSMTTKSKHQPAVHAAIDSDATVVYCPDLYPECDKDGHGYNLEYFTNRIHKELVRLGRATVYRDLYSLVSLIEDADEYCRAFGIEQRFMPPLILADAIEEGKYGVPLSQKQKDGLIQLLRTVVAPEVDWRPNESVSEDYYAR